MKKLTAVFLTIISTLALAGCTQNNEEPTAEKTFEGNGFTVEYPSEYIADDEGLWTEEAYEWHINPPEACDLCQIPYIEIHAEATNKTLEEFIIDYHSLPGETLEEMSEQTTLPYKETTIGDYDFIKITVPDMFSITGYYTKHNNTVLAFRTYHQDFDEEELVGIIEHLNFK